MASAAQRKHHALRLEKWHGCAAAYVRMSTEHQRYSTESQMAEISRYAEAHRLTLASTYKDNARSGLSFAGRAGLQRLIKDVTSGKATFGTILVYDVSRWGRFQDVDEPAYYEFLCRMAGIRVVYCAETFKDDGTPMSFMLKSMRRVMAAEFSRDLSTKVFNCQRIHALRGYHPGGQAGYGLRRLLVSQNGTPKGYLNHGEYKALQTDRVLLVLGPTEEVETVRWMFTALVDGLTQAEIVRRLNMRGLRGPRGRPWTSSNACKILGNEKYAGVSVWNRNSFKLKGPRVVNRLEDRVRVPEAIEPIISADLYRRAQECRRNFRIRTNPEVMLRGLRDLYQRTGDLTCAIIDACPTLPAANTYGRVFGSMLNAYRRVGFMPPEHRRELSLRRRARQRGLLREIEAILKSSGIRVELKNWLNRLRANEELTIVVKVLPPRETPAGSILWCCERVPPDGEICLLARELPEGGEDYYILPRAKLPRLPFTMGRDTGPISRAFYATDLGAAVSSLTRKTVSEVGEHADN